MSTESEIQNSANGHEERAPALQPVLHSFTSEGGSASDGGGSRIQNPASPPSDSQPPVFQNAPDGGGSTINDQLTSRRRNGNVARLPKEIRQRINEMLDDGVPYNRIIENLGDHGKELNADIMYRWKIGGYQDYLNEQRLLDQCRVRSQSAYHLLTTSNNINTFQATQQLAVAQICETVADLGPEVLRQAIIANPLNYFRMLNSFARLTNGGLKCERHLIDDADRQRKLESRDAPRKKGISDESVKEMQEKLKLM
jgi:hypothetical protein